MWRYLSSYESTDDAQADVHLYPGQRACFRLRGKVNVDDNQWVEKGTVLVEIDPKDYEVAVAQAQANLASAEATAQSLNITVPITSVNTSSQLKSTASDIENANAGVIAAERQLAAAHAQLEAAEANDVRAQDDLQRYKLLVDKREVAPQIYDQALATAKSSTATVAAARANESAAQQFVQQARSRVGASRCQPPICGNRAAASVLDAGARARGDCRCGAKTRSSSNRPQLNLQYTKIVAPGQRRSE